MKGKTYMLLWASRRKSWIIINPQWDATALFNPCSQRSLQDAPFKYFPHPQCFHSQSIKVLHHCSPNNGLYHSLLQSASFFLEPLCMLCPLSLLACIFMLSPGCYPALILTLLPCLHEESSCFQFRSRWSFSPSLHLHPSLPVKAAPAGLLDYTKGPAEAI